MPVVNDFPDLSHWFTVQEFTITQAALLLSGIDPLDYPTLEVVKEEKHERWRMAWGFAYGMVTAIRRGVLTPVLCVAYVWGDMRRLTPAEMMDRSNDISMNETIITRYSLQEWVRNERVDYVRPPRSTSVKEVTPSNQPVVIDAESRVINSEETVLLTYGHKSEGLEYVEDAIKNFWATYEPENPQTAPTKTEIEEYLMKMGAGSNMAKAVNLILRPFSLQQVGRRKKKNK
ncbi:TPA: hypothetical protein KC759_002648 [Escherichia coli O146]|uniref:hypothetical protein n=1 Tax=Escherichia coli TaxID=562 RepID=UPI0010CC3427|nr:hypothetical protein [Escherichia coli]HBC3160176.1 hypothetical protein [Escherichia coli O146]HDQ6714597.1 hypothetical protein [Escherichia coli O113:H4]HDQ6813639.1 hypothetical protein [Escherichia coli O174:H8]EET1468984.1 hypothetical protein [Escherichia coli]EEV0614497.1 hypothetical protein [Escherichia coli]